MVNRQERLRAAVVAFHRWPSASKLRIAVSDGLLNRIQEEWNTFDEETRNRLTDQIETLSERNVDVLFSTDDGFPVALGSLHEAPPVLFTIGNRALLDTPGVGMCGSRHVSPKGLEAARLCGEEVASNGLVIISGYARGVDTETHLAALSNGGRTIIVLAEGILHFRRKRAFASVEFENDRVLIVSQFPPGLSWNAGAAMTRNAIIAALGRALVVIEAGPTGGTLDAGKKALRMRRPVLALQFLEHTPEGNQILFKEGAVPITSTQHLRRVINAISETPALKSEQLTII